MARTFWTRTDVFHSPSLRVRLLREAKQATGWYTRAYKWGSGRPVAAIDVLEYVNRLAQQHGVESIVARHWEGHYRGLYYVNTGETYNLTLTFDTGIRAFRWQSWGDWVESLERRGYTFD